MSFARGTNSDWIVLFCGRQCIFVKWCHVACCVRLWEASGSISHFCSHSLTHSWGVTTSLSHLQEVQGEVGRNTFAGNANCTQELHWTVHWRTLLYQFVVLRPCHSVPIFQQFRLLKSQTFISSQQDSVFCWLVAIIKYTAGSLLTNNDQRNSGVLLIIDRSFSIYRTLFKLEWTLGKQFGYIYYL